MNEENVVPTCCAPQETGGPDLEQQLVFHDPLHWFDEEVVELQAVPQLLPELLGQGQMGWFCSLESPLVLTILSPFPQSTSATDLKIAVPKF